jgi:O-antigen/teichoic acid export membrane protein
MTEKPASSLRGRVLRGVVWKAISQALGQGTSTIVAIILARLLVPSDYGIAAMVIVFAAVVPVFSDVALGAALVQRRNLTEADKSTVFWTSTGVGLAFTILGFLASWPIADFYGEPEVQPLFAALSLTFVVTALSGTQKALLTREMNFRRLELMLMGANLAAGIGGIALAVAGYGAWAIIGQQVIAAVVTTALLWFLTGWTPSFTFSMASLRSMFRFSANVFSTRLLFYVNRNADNLLIGRVLGSTALGMYALAYNLMLVPSSRLTWPVTDVLFPAFSEIQDDARRVAQAWFRVTRAIGAVTVPAMLGLIVVAPEFVVVVLGDKWSPAIPLVRLLAWVGLLQSLQGLNSSILLARDRTGTLLRYAVIVAVATVASFLGGIHWGVVGVAAAYAIASTIVEPYYTWLTARSIDASLRELWSSISGVAQAAGAMAVVVLAAREALIGQGASNVVLLLTLIPLGIAVYLPLLAWREPEVLGELRALRNRPDPAPVAAPVVTEL